MKFLRILFDLIVKFLITDKIFRILISNKILVLLFHDVSINPSSFSKNYNLNIKPKNFEKQISIISEYFNFIEPKELLNKNATRPQCLITFDDGLHSYFENALPILEKYNAPSIIFFNLEPMNDRYFWAALIHYLYDNDEKFYREIEDRNIKNKKEPTLSISRDFINNYLKENDNEIDLKNRLKEYHGPFTNYETLKKFQNHKLVFYGNHLFNHYNSLTLSDLELEHEFDKNQTLINQYQNGTKLFSYPYGQPITCYNFQTNSIISKKADQIFSSYHAINTSNEKFFFHRISFEDSDVTKSDIKKSILKGYIRFIFNGKRKQLI